MDIYTKIAERRIEEAMANGEFTGLPGSGRPLRFEDESLIPEDLRLAYRILKNAGCIPPELELRNEIVSLRSMIESLDDNRERMKRIMEINYKLLRINEMRQRPLTLDEIPEYAEKLYDRFL